MCCHRAIPQVTASFSGEDAVLEAKGRHDSCVLPRAPAIVEGMAACVLIDAALMQRARWCDTVGTSDDDVSPAQLKRAKPNPT